MCLHIHYYSRVCSPKHVSAVSRIYGSFAAASERQGSDTLEAGKCSFFLPIKCFFFPHFGAAPCMTTRERDTTDAGIKKI